MKYQLSALHPQMELTFSVLVINFLQCYMEDIC